jgi:hypothetical protein
MRVIASPETPARMIEPELPARKPVLRHQIPREM